MVCDGAGLAGLRSFEMPNYRITEIDRILADYCHAISSPRRNLLIRLLGERERTVSELVELTGFSISNVSQHLKILRDKRIVAVRRAGSYATYRMAHTGLLDAMETLRVAVLESMRASGSLPPGVEISAPASGEGNA